MWVHDRIFIGGEWISAASTDVIDVVSPHSEEIIGRVPAGTPADMDRAVAAAREAFDNGPWPRTDVTERAAAIARLAEIFGGRMGELADLITAEMGAPISFARMGHTAHTQGLWSYYADLGTRTTWEDERPGMLGPVIVRKEPVGVVAAIVPWNVPQGVIAAKLAPALLAGCTVVLKPAPETPLDAYLLAEMIEEVGFPPGVVNVVVAGRETGEYLVRHEGVDKVAFTGSTAAGRRIGAICGERLKRCTLELGGKSAAIICDDADLGATMGWLKLAALVNNGQACVAQTRILASSRRYNEVVDALAGMVSEMKVGDPADPTTEIGPLVTRRQQERVESYIRSGQAEGAKVVTGAMTRPYGTGWYVAPTVFAGVDNSMRIAQEEIFGPVLSVIAYHDEADAVRIADDSTYGLAGSVWTSDPERGLAIARQVRTGSFGVNMYGIEPGAPYGGHKASGIGREGGPEGLAAYLEYKTILRSGA